MKRLINRLICRIWGHDYIVKGVSDIEVDDEHEEIICKCERCGKITDVVKKIN